jgi:hypothetical protein
MLRESLEKPWMPTGACPRALDPGVGMTKTVGRRVTVNAGWYYTASQAEPGELSMY